MRRFFIYLLITLFLVLFGAASPASPSGGSADSSLFAQTKSWYFESWSSDITINDDSTMEVVETHKVSFSGSFSWIKRELPKTKGIWYEFGSVKDENGEVYGDVEISQTKALLSISVNFSAQDESKTFIYSYKVYNAIGDFDDYDELYWNVISNDRDVRIDRVTARVHLPKPAYREDLKQRILVGETGSEQEIYSYRIEDTATLYFEGLNIAPFENFTIVAGWTDNLFPVQTYKEPKTLFQAIWEYLRWIWWFSPLFVLFYLIYRYRRYGKDPKGRVTIAPEFEPPASLKPAEMGVIIDEKVNLRDITSTIIDLAVRGYLEITEEKKKSIFGGKTYSFTKTKKADEKLLDYEKEIINGLFGSKDRVSLSDLKNDFYKHIKPISSSLYKEVTDNRGYFVRRPDKIRAIYLGTGIVIFVVGMVGFIWLWPMSVIGGMVALFAGAMPKKTREGVLTWEKIQGFKLFLSKTETERMKLIDHPKWFEQYLPYAMILGVEKQWAKKFEGIYKEPPSWYHGYYGAFSTVAFTSSFSKGMTSAVGRTLASSPSSSGASGFGGGGFAGGGGGGGGSSAG